MQPVQCKMARIALGWGVRDLAKAAEVAPASVTRFEGGHGMQTRTTDAIRATLEAAGIIFIHADDTAGPGVRLRK